MTCEEQLHVADAGSRVPAAGSTLIATWRPHGQIPTLRVRDWYSELLDIQTFDGR